MVRLRRRRRSSRSSSSFPPPWRCGSHLSAAPHRGRSKESRHRRELHAVRRESSKSQSVWESFRRRVAKRRTATAPPPPTETSPRRVARMLRSRALAEERGPLSLAPPAALPLPIQNLVGTSGEEVSCPAFATSRVCASLGARESWRLRDALSPRARHTRLFRDFQRGHTHAHLHTRPILPGHVCVVCASLSKVFAPVSSTSSVFFQTHAAEEYAAARR